MFSFPEACRSGDELRLGWGIWGIFFVILPNVLLIALMGVCSGAGKGGVLKG
jgi:hypothetical protein